MCTDITFALGIAPRVTDDMLLIWSQDEEEEDIIVNTSIKTIGINNRCPRDIYLSILGAATLYKFKLDTFTRDINLAIPQNLYKNKLN